MIFYFSATGNSKYAAERIASAAGDRTVFLRDAVRGRSYRYDVSREERIGFVFPVYFWGLPSILRFFVEKLELTGYRDQYIYAVMTCGGSTGGAADQLTGLLEKKGLSLSAQFGIPMVDNYVPMFKVVGPEEAEARLDAAEEYIDEAARAIRAKGLGDYNRCRGHDGGPLPPVRPRPVHQALCGDGPLHRLRAVPGDLSLRGHPDLRGQAGVDQAPVRAVPGMPPPLSRPGHPLEEARRGPGPLLQSPSGALRHRADRKQKFPCFFERNKAY